ncbi:MAG: hypothetical protein ACTTKW_00415 [Schwartzia sp. (in: firmicutes)]
MGKIPKNLSDKDMFKNYQEEPTIEETFQQADQVVQDPRQGRTKAKREWEALGLSPEISDAMEHMLVEMKVELYREGVVDYRLTVRRDGKNIILSPVVKHP